MGISVNIARQMIRVAPLLAGRRNGIMLGRQKMHFRPRWKLRVMRELADRGIEADAARIFPEDGWCEPFLEAIGWPPLESLDFSGIEGAAHIHDLSTPIPESLRGRFDVIYDGGTTEHVFDIAQAFRNVHGMLRDDGIFISCVGADGWFGHGFYQIGPDVPWRFWGATLGYDVQGCWTFPRRQRAEPTEIPDPTLSPRGAERRFDLPQLLFYVVRKNGEPTARTPTIQSHYVNY